MLPDNCNSDTSTVISEGCAECLPCCGACTSDAVYAEIHPGSSVKELFRRKGEKIPHVHCNSVSCVASRSSLKKSVSKLAYQCKRRCHHQHQHQRSPLHYDLYVLKSEDTDTDTSVVKTPKDAKEVEVRKARSSDEPTESTSQHTRRALTLKKPSVLCVPRVCQADSSIVRQRNSRSRNCRLCHHHYCSWMKEDFLHASAKERRKKSSSRFPEGEELDKNMESRRSEKDETKKDYIENEFHCVSSELSALLKKCEREIADKDVPEGASSKQDPPVGNLQPRIPLSIQRKLKEQMKQTRREPSGQHDSQTKASPATETRGIQTRQPFNFTDPSFPKMCYEANSEQQWFDNQQRSSPKNESSIVYDDEPNSVATEGTSEAESHYSTNDKIPVQQKPSPRTSSHESTEQKENDFTEQSSKMGRGILDKHLYDPESFYEQDLQFRRGSQGDGPISSNASNSEILEERKPSPKPRKSRCKSIKKTSVLPYCLEPQNVFLSTCNRQHCTNVEHSHKNLQQSPRSTREQRNKWVDGNEFRQHQEEHTATEAFPVLSVPFQALSAETNVSASSKNASQDREIPRSPAAQKKKPGTENPALTDMLKDLDSYIESVTTDTKHQQERGEGNKSVLESSARQGKRSMRVSNHGNRPFKSRSLTSISLPNYQEQAFEVGDYKSWMSPVRQYEQKMHKEEGEQSDSLNSSESCIASVIQTAMHQEIRTFVDKSPYAKHEARNETPPEGATVETKPIDRINDATSREQIVQSQNSVEDNADCRVNESFTEWPDIYKMGTEYSAIYNHLISVSPGKEADYIRELRKMQWDHLNRIKREIQSLEELVRFLDNYGSNHGIYSTHSAPS